jgi:formylglycine-generating enzyme required for sulfatase activity
MKRIILFALITWSLELHAIPEKILPKTKILKPASWYASQLTEWDNYVKHNILDADGWLNYYTAARFAQKDREYLIDIVNNANRSIPNTYEALFINGWDGGFTRESIEYLRQAYRLNPGHAASYGLLALASEFEHDQKSRAQYLQKMHDAGLFSTSLLSYSYNVLMSVESRSILITEGENTTLPLMALQDIWKIRPDVVILNLDMISSPEYRTTKLGTYGLQLKSTESTQHEEKQLLCANLPAENQGHKFYYALTLSSNHLTNIKDHLYVVGLASQASATRVDNIELIKDNLEKRFLLDYLSVDFNGASEFDAGTVLSANYLVPLLLLHEHYKEVDNVEKKDETSKLIYQIAANTKKEDLVNSFLNRKKSTSIPYFPASLNIKSLENNFRALSNTLLVDDGEIRNEQYNKFLAYLVEHNLKEEYEKYKFDLSAYTEPALSMMKNYTSSRTPTKKDKYFTQYPAVNISHEAAVAYCDWLTEQYNRSSDKKYKKVKFRLPTVNEFQMAAAAIKNPSSWNLNEQLVDVKVFPAGKEFSKNFELKKVSAGDPDILYPWFRFYNFRNSAKNHKGCYLGNFKIPENQKPCVPSRMNTADGFMAMSPVKSYFPNDIGLYDVVGNVAEMTLEKGKACGGSWNHPPEESTIKSVNLYNGPDSAIGFRVYMEIIEQ